ncbi:ATPase, F1 complex, delta/epsilon subunit [uncultured Paludibacter sp.]|nr:ATPase, F1 complex, delta/epsilon subunit [uncultured Paludibacter sp.]
MKLEIITPEQIYFSGEVSLVTLPGAKGSFTVLDHHAPIISFLNKGKLVYETGGQTKELNISGGFMEMSHNNVTVAVETLD